MTAATTQPAGTPLTLEAVMAALGGADEKTLANLDRQTRAGIAKAGASALFVPNPGPQTEAWFCEADELFYGGEAGGGKSALLAGLATTQHTQSLILRRTNPEVEGLVEEVERIVGSRQGYNSQRGIWRLAGRSIALGGCQLERDKQKHKGKPRDLMGFDEIGDFLESQYTFIIGWNRSAKPGQRSRIVATGNPPTTAEGLWVIKRWAAWLDPKHPNPAKPGELRWYTNIDGRDTEVDGPGPHDVGGQQVMARSRTFIRARLSDNPDLAETDYDATLAALPEEYRQAYRDGRFDLALQDSAFQTIPTEWIRAAQRRWTPQPPAGVPMCAIGVDCSGGGRDPMILAPRHDGWYAALVVVPGKELPIEHMGSYGAGIVVANRRDGAKVIVDMGGGYGGPIYGHLSENGVEVGAYKGGTGANGRTRDGKVGFVNMRSQTIWRFREALDPDQPGGSPIMLPDDPELVADLTAPKFRLTPRGYEVEAKEKVCARLGRSTDKGDAVVMAWSDGLKQAQVRGGFSSGGGRRGQKFDVVLGHQAARRSRR